MGRTRGTTRGEGAAKRGDVVRAERTKAVEVPEFGAGIRKGVGGASNALCAGVGSFRWM